MGPTLIAIAAAWIAALGPAWRQHTHGPMYHFPQWSPDGKSILVSSTIDGDAELFLFPVEGGQPRKLTDNTWSDDMAIWIDRGRRILFMSDRRGKPERFVMNADGTNQQPTDIEPPPVTSPDGRTRLEESVAGGVGVLIAVGPDGSRRTITKGPYAEQGSYSPDGQWIVYEQRSPGAPNDIANSNIVVAKPDGSAPAIVASGTDPSWAPDGGSILFKTFDRQAKRLWIATVARDGTGLRRLAPGVHPHWSPDGRRIAFVEDGGPGDRNEVWVMDRDGTNQRCLTCRVRLQADHPGPAKAGRYY
jgi:Tol biopolymer transport system component